MTDSSPVSRTADTPVPSGALSQALVIGITILGLVLRLVYLGHKSLWIDEGTTAGIVASSDVWRLSIFTGQSLYLLLLHPWVRVAGSSEALLRLPSALFSAADVPLVYLVGIELGEPRIAVIAALLMAVNMGSIRYAQTARSYALVVMLVTMAVLFFLKALKRPSPANRTGYVVGGALGAYAHLFSVLLLPALLLSPFLMPSSPRARERLTVSTIALGLLAAPAFAITVHGDVGQANWITHTTLGSVITLFRTLVGAPGFTYLSGEILGLVYLAGMVGAVSVAARDAARRPTMIFLAIMAFTPIAINFAVSFVKPLFIDRYLLICQPFLVLLAAAGLAQLTAARTLIAVIAITVAAAFYGDWFYYRNEQNENWRDAVQYIAQEARPGDGIVIYIPAGRRTVDYYRARLAHPDGFPPIAFPLGDTLSEIGPKYELFTDSLRSTLSAPRKRTWLILNHTDRYADSVQTILGILDRSSRSAGIRSFNGVIVMLFESKQ
jgi:4-amino-4-deoxy-L-arabinose transferase-like glycosyltransferase